MSSREGGFFKGIIFGGLIGAGLAVLFAPDKGEKIREKVKKEAASWKKEIEKQLAEIEDDGKSLGQKAQEFIKESPLPSAAQQTMAAVKKVVEERVADQKPKEKHKNPRFFKGLSR